MNSLLQYRISNIDYILDNLFLVSVSITIWMQNKLSDWFFFYSSHATETSIQIVMETLKINLTTTYFAEASFQYKYTSSQTSALHFQFEIIDI